MSDFILGGSKITADSDCSLEIKRHLLLGETVNDQPRKPIKRQRPEFASKGSSNQSYSFSSSPVWMWELDYKVNWAPKNWCFWTVVLEKTLESPLDSKEIQPVNPKGNQSWIFIGRIGAEAETPVLLSPDARNWLIWRGLDPGNHWGREKGATEDDMVGCITNSMDTSLSKLQELVMDREGLACCGSWGHKELDVTEWLNWTEVMAL